MTLSKAPLPRPAVACQEDPIPRFSRIPGPFGVQADDVDLSQPLSGATFAELGQAFYDHQVLAFRAQDISATPFGAFARRFGSPQPHVIDQFHHPEDSNILILSNVKKNGEPTGLGDAGSYFHTDYSYLAVPARATTLYSRVVPKVGGQHAFRQSDRRLRRPARCDEGGRRAAVRDPPLRQLQRHPRAAPPPRCSPPSRRRGCRSSRTRSRARTR